jgi:hypothetical protein
MLTSVWERTSSVGVGEHEERAESLGALIRSPCNLRSFIQVNLDIFSWCNSR